MKIVVKELLGEERTIEVNEDIRVLDLKILVEAATRVAVGNQKLLVSGKLLRDEKLLSEYAIKDGTKLNLFVNRQDESSNRNSASPNRLRSEMFKVLREFFSEANANKVADEYMKQVRDQIASLSLDDIERIATSYLQEEEEQTV